MKSFAVLLPKGSRAIVPVVAALALAGCAQDTSPYRTSNINRVIPEGNAVTITHASSEADARPLAEGYCSKLDKAAHFERIVSFRPAHARTSSNSAVFICEAN